jgi:signal transduction histidine kinase
MSKIRLFRLVNLKALPENSRKSLGLLFMGLLLITALVLYSSAYIRKTTFEEFALVCSDLQSKMETGLRAHAQLLKSGAALFAVTDTVTREMWSEYYERSRINRFLPGIVSFGYAEIVHENDLDTHIQSLRRQGFPDYRVFPEGEREVYAPFIFLEPFDEKNFRAFGYDMLFEPVRRKALKTARDSNFAVLSGKVRLVQETEETGQGGTVMFFPIYQKRTPVTTLNNRQAAIKGWITIAYNIEDLVHGILGSYYKGHQNMRLNIYFNEISESSLLYSSHKGEETTANSKLSITLPVWLNSEKWIMVFTGNYKFGLLNINLLIVLISGIIISILLLLLTISLIKSHRNSERIQNLNEQFEKLNSEKDRFIAILGHDLRNPFNSILGFLHILIKDFHVLGKAKIESYLNYLNAVAQNTFELLENLLVWSKAQSGKVPFLPQLVNFKDIFAEIQNYFYPISEEKNITINNTGDDIIIFADVDMLKTILRNLCSNAIKFTHEGGEINIDARVVAGNAHITVSDNGIGIEPENLSCLFTLSRSFSTKGTANETGTGLGLIICREFVTIHGGEIWAESKIGEGSMFVFTLPLDPASCQS